MRIGLGIDTGGTYTDAVLYDFEEEKVVASAKALTTKEDLSHGIGEALDRLPGERLAAAELVSLSTTLATNACVEDRGGRAGLIFIGGDRRIVERNGAAYGLPPAEELYFLDAAILSDGRVEREPDWEGFRGDCPSFLRNADSAAIVAYQGIHNAAPEQRAKEIVAETCGLNAVCGNELFWNLNYIKRGASSLLNARLIPVIDTFLEAIRDALARRGVQAPMVIVRSDGSLMSEAFSRQRPVETILCGPAASVMGGMKLAGKQDCLVVDMGGTTTDIAIVRNGNPVKTDGVTIGKWDTFVQSVYIHTFGLGGDSRILLDRETGLMLGPQRVLPLCAAASRWPVIKEGLRELLREKRRFAYPLHEFLYLVRDIGDDPYYTETERAVCRALRRGPLRLDRLAEAVESDLYVLDLDRLERETILMRCGMTPTDILHIQGDFTRFDREASDLAAAYFTLRTKIPAEALCEQVCDAVKKRLYTHIVRMLLENEDPAYKGEADKGLDRLIASGWDNRENKEAFLRLSFRTPAALVGIGAPIHMFLPDVATALGTACIIPENAPVANALGAVVGHISAAVTAKIEPGQDEEGRELYRIYTPGGALTAPDEETALRLARQAAEKEARREAERRGVSGDIAVSTQVMRQTASIGHAADSMQEIVLSLQVTATATGGAAF